VAHCKNCRSRIWFGGGLKDGAYQFCNEHCWSQELSKYSGRFSEDEVRETVTRVHGGPCPVCKGPGPVDVRHFHTVWSAIFWTSWESRRKVVCRACGLKHQIGSTLFCLFLGWWGFPWGLILTPVQLIRNVGAIFTKDSRGPSQQLELVVRTGLARSDMQNRRVA
jgi:hypothetical protein